jgi:tetratricopeptide (TPR) repeat protein
MSSELGTWLRQQREARGWPKAEMARRLVQAAHQAGDNSVPSTAGMLHNIHRWEREGGVSERHKLHYCRALSIQPGQFGPSPAGYPDSGVVPGSTSAVAVSAAAAAVPVPARAVDGIGELAGPSVPASAAIAYRERQEPSLGHFTVQHEVVMTAHDSSDHAADHEQHGIGEATLEQLRADLTRLASLSDTGAPLSAFLDMRRVRDRIYRLLDRRLWPGEQADLYILLGCLHELMGLAANRLGYPDAAEELLRAGWAYATAIGHDPLRGMLRARLSYVMFWRGRYSESRDLAADGLRYASQGLVGANLHLEHARALARLGDPEAARREVGLAHAARQSGYPDDLTAIGGEEFALSRAATFSMAGGALAEVGDGREAAGELDTAIRLYEEGPGPGEQHGVAGQALAGADLAVVRVRTGALDGAVAALEPVLILPPAQRVATLTARLARVRNELAAPVFRDSPQARDLGDQIEEYGREAITAGLHSLSGLS